MSIRVAHLADIQIRNFKRHWEFKRSFKNLYASLIQKKVDLIVIVGDVAHTKTNISPEFVQMCAKLFRELSDIAPLVIIPGNHDGNLNNLDRLDALTPIVEALDRDNIYYYKDSGVYLHGLLDFVVFSCFDAEDKWPTEKDIHNDKINIGLYHGMLQGVALQNGTLVEDALHCDKDFLNKVDYLMLGDVHKMQILDHTYRAAYPGSYPQQNYGETIEKGYLLWDIESKDKHEVDFIELANVCPFYTIDFKGDIDGLKNLKIQKKARIRVLCNQLDIFDKQKVKDEINALFEPKELKIIDDVCPDRQEIQFSAAGIKIENLDDLGVQEKLIRYFLSSRNLDEKLLQKIMDINQKYNVQVRSQDDVLRNVQYRLGNMKWSNIGPFGEDNEFNFSTHKGVLGVFGKNAVGKSSLAVDIPSYCMFNRISKNVTKNDLLINENKTSCSAELEIFVGKDLHKIKRTTNVYLKSGKKDGDPVYQGKTEVDYRVVHGNGHVEIRNGLERSDTDNSYIRKDFGTAEDFMDTSIAPQWQLLNFINKGPTERQRLIGRYFDVDIFEKKHELAKKQLKEIKAQLAIYDKRNLGQEKEECEKNIADCKLAIEAREQEKNTLEVTEKETEALINQLQAQIMSVQINSAMSEDALTIKIERAKVNIINLRKKNEEAQTAKTKKNEFDITSLRQASVSWSQVRELEASATSLEKGCKCKHDEGCSHYLKIKQYKREAQKIRDSLTMVERDVNLKLEEYRNVKIDSNDYDLMINQATEVLKLLERDLDFTIRHKEQLVENAVLRLEIEIQRTVLNNVKNKIRTVMQSAISQSANMGKFESTKNEITNQQLEADILRKEYEAYDYFMQTMSKDGISRVIIAENVGLINKEIEKILSQGVDFTVELESSENGKAIEIYFKHPKSHKRVIEICSGMEKVMAGIAIRAALIRVTTLPKSNMLVLDEITCLDAEYLNSFVNILNYLKSVFDLIILVSHEDSLKDQVDCCIEIDRNDEGYSIISE